MSIGEIIKQERRHRGLRQADLGKALGVSNATVARYESGETPITVEQVEAISDLLDVNILSIYCVRKDYERMMNELIMNSLPNEIKARIDEALMNGLSTNES